MPSASSRHTASVNKRRSPPPEPTLRRHQLPTMKSDFLASKVKRKDGESSLKVKSDETMINGHPHSAELLREKGGKVEMRSVTDEERKDGEAVSRKRKADVMEFDGEVMTTLKNGLAMMARGLAEISLAFGRLESSHPSPVMPHSQDPIFRPPTVDRKASIIKKASSRPTIVDLTLAQPRKRPKLDDPNRPKKPKNAYMLFCDDVRERSRKEGLKITQAELTTEAGMMWKEMGKKEKDVRDLFVLFCLKSVAFLLRFLTSLPSYSRFCCRYQTWS
ncbi:hypothetical protein BC829DRAFT_132173 [Chytridium lagenaria]|nr:hypothetical protein BC829DRAFT_132173 [Chytridium lagenaria]